MLLYPLRFIKGISRHFRWGNERSEWGRDWIQEASRGEGILWAVIDLDWKMAFLVGQGRNAKVGELVTPHGTTEELKWACKETEAGPWNLLCPQVVVRLASQCSGLGLRYSIRCPPTCLSMSYHPVLFFITFFCFLFNEIILFVTSYCLFWLP